MMSPPWQMKPGITRWNTDPLNVSFLPFASRFSPVHRHRKFSAVLETTSALRLITMRPIFWPPILISKKTLGFNFASRPL